MNLAPSLPRPVVGIERENRPPRASARREAAELRDDLGTLGAMTRAHDISRDPAARPLLVPVVSGVPLDRERKEKER